MVLLLVVAVLVLLPVAEVWLVIEVGGRLGVIGTVAALVAVSIIGTAIVRAEGLRVMRAFLEATAQGEMPTREIVHGAFLVASGVLLLVPGFVSDILGIVLLLPPMRAAAAALVVRRGRGSRRVTVIRADRASGSATAIIDVASSTEEDDGGRTR